MSIQDWYQTLATAISSAQITLLACKGNDIIMNYYYTFLTGFQSGGIHSLWFNLPDCRVVSLGMGKVHYYSTSGNSKGGSPKPPSGDAPTAEKVLSGATKVTPTALGNKLCIYILYGIVMCSVTFPATP